jgi:hypothetical protein
MKLKNKKNILKLLKGIKPRYKRGDNSKMAEKEVIHSCLS